MSTAPIPRCQFEAYEQIILSGQIEQQDMAPLFDANPEFSEWYRERALKRHPLC